MVLSYGERFRTNAKMLDILRDAPVGRFLRFTTGKRLFAYPEDSTDFQLPSKYRNDSSDTKSSIPMTKFGDENKNHQPSDTDIEAASDSTMNNSEDQDAGMNNKIEFQRYTVVDWYSETDPENPLNWGHVKKTWVTVLLLAYVIAVYIGSSLYTASIPDIIEHFNVSDVVAALGLALYVFGYGVGPMLWSPLSEIPAVGRNPPYIFTFLVFVVLCVPAAVIDDFGGILVLRFLLGFFGAPALATAGASVGDCFTPRIQPYMIVSWTGGAVIGPALGPLVGGFAVQVNGWRWSFWELLWLSAPVLILMLSLFPETSGDAILYRRAKRLRLLTGRSDIRTAAEIKRAQMSKSQIMFDALIKPWEINILDPSVLFITLYTGLIYSIFYSFFESFPLVYQDVYGFNLGETGLAYLSVLIGTMIAVVGFIVFQYFYARPKQAQMDRIPPEEMLRPGLVATVCIPVGLFLFAWTSRSSVHWAPSMLGAVIAIGSIYTVATCLLNYLPLTYSQYAGSLFAANSLARASTAAAAILYGRPMFIKLGVAGGVSLLTGLTILCSAGFYVLFIFGPTLRKRSRFAVN